ncbi:BgTH12-05414 [Blumeria graminis f. sp. triticale]|uniref:BgtE-10116 n=2 Tax=Blumeria graminis TaxID=34373 RepID=A0A9X9QD30_BLUGR|nr:BgTH12-05414 [Blumeria graminis f. sp. triticale]VDB88324.1 BgtE-10116 [Blumeria graminis f. sp. tritici]
MHSNRLISCLGIWLISIIAVVQCFTNYNCGNGVEITATEALRVHGQAMSYLADVAANIRPAIKVPYRGTIKNLPTPTYFWHIKSLANHQGEVVVNYFMLTSSTGEFLMIISTGWMKEIGEDDTWCPGT